MQTIYTAQQLARFTQVITATGSGVIVAGGANVNGIVIQSTTWKWVLGAAASSLSAELNMPAGLFHDVFDDNGAGGVVNVPALLSHQSPIQMQSGVALSWNAVIAGTARLALTVNYRLL